MTQKERRQHLFRVFLKSKLLFACFSLVLSLLLIVGSTYAWITSADERVNRSDVNERRLSAIIEEDFNRVYRWAPGTTKEKNVRVRNTGEMPAIVRLSLKEFLVIFETVTNDNHDHTTRNGNGNLKVYGQPTTSIKVEDPSTWVSGNTYGINGSTFYKASNSTLTNQTYQYDALNTRNAALVGFELEFMAGKVFDATNPPLAGTTEYWYYENGYFYYSEVLPPKGVTPNLLDSVSLSDEYANQYKGALYKLVSEMDAHDLTRELFSDWSIPENGTNAIFKMYDKKIDQRD
ncbi:hypothetical protein JZO70_06165 [Enterococcus sp. 669A]|uniref:Alternate signal-mediated exported protein n=1 Tax=Candidatus Enterococcus moelleringii TaxID=2815325 RepID=A0ABS3L9J1_9ENTE|nr:BsaA family SipW-dependent biofilm matrix protein [Enterococcus sp. 669A]MBO1305733.1 hypothetical protein [Enterococcus sp. 669A]